MSLFAILKTAHVICALLSVSGFALRGYWTLQGNPRLKSRVVKVLPHAVDTCLLVTAVGMLWIWNVSPLSLPWVMAKLVALLLYIGAGMVALRFARTTSGILAAYIAALCVAAYIIAVALTHSPLGPLG